MSTTTLSSIEDVRACLDLIAARVPDRHVTIGDAETAAYYVELKRFHRDVLFEAARLYSGDRFPSAGQLFAHVVEVARAVVTEQSALASAEGRGYCSECTDGSGWYLIDLAPTSTETVRPCSLCAPVEYAMWRHRSAEGHDEHHCGVCIALKARGRSNEPDWLTEARAKAAGSAR